MDWIQTLISGVERDYADNYSMTTALVIVRQIFFHPIFRTDLLCHIER